MAYAEGTTVSVERSQMEIAQLIGKYGAEQFGTGWNRGYAIVTFSTATKDCAPRQIRFLLEIKSDVKEFRTSPGGRARTEVQARKAMEDENKRRWRALALGIKAKLEIVASGIATFEHEFAMNVVLPDGTTVAEHVLREIAVAYERGVMPRSFLELDAGHG